jgi:LysM repeat protein
MDTISSRENNSILPLAGVIVGVLALILAAVSLVKVSNANKQIVLMEEKVMRIDSIESQAVNAAASAEKANADLRKLQGSMQDAVNQIGTMIGDVKASVAKLEEAQKAHPVAGKGGAPAVAGPGEYIVKKGDIGTSIARANGCSVGDLVAVNPGVNFNRLAVGQKLKLPAKK